MTKKKCMYTKDEFTDEDRKVLCEGCEEDCQYNVKQTSRNKDYEALFKQFKKENPDWKKYLTDSIYYDLAGWYDVKKGIANPDDYSEEGLKFTGYIWHKYFEEKPSSIEEDFAKLVGHLVQDIVANEKDASNFDDKKKPTKYFVEKYLPKFKSLFCNESGVDKERLSAMLDDALAKETPESWNKFLDNPCDNCDGDGLPGTCASIMELGRCRIENKRKYGEHETDDIDIAASDYVMNPENFITYTAVGFAQKPVQKDDIDLIIKAVKFGAQWQKEKDKEGNVLIFKYGFDTCKEAMLENAVEGELRRGYIVAKDVQPLHIGLNADSKFKLVIIKEE